MLPVTARISSRPASAIPWLPSGRSASGFGSGRCLGGLLGLLRLDLAGDDLRRRDRGPLAALRLDLGLGPTVELSAPLGREHDEDVPVADLLQGFFERWERHQAAPPGRVVWTPPPAGRSGRVRVR